MNIEHDPERGCGPCPFVATTRFDEGDGYWFEEPSECRADDRVKVETYGPAPAGCPLRTGPVTVHAPEVKP